VYELDKFFTTLLGHIEGASSLEELLVSTVTCATRELRNDDHLALMLASEPGAVLGELTVDGLPRIIRVATAYLIPFADEFLPRPQSRALIDIVARLVISYFLAPSTHYDLADPASAASFIAQFITPAFDGQPVGR
jgi:hypothetical protein